MSIFFLFIEFYILTTGFQMYANDGPRYYCITHNRQHGHVTIPSYQQQAAAAGDEGSRPVCLEPLEVFFFFSSFFDYTNLFTFTVITTELVPEPVPAPALAPAPAPTAYEKRPKRCETRRLGPK